MTAKNKPAIEPETTTLNLSPSQGDEERSDGGGNNPHPESSIGDPVSYYTQRIVNELGVTPEINRIRLKFEDTESKTVREVEYPIFSADEADNIRILPFTINRELLQFDNVKATPTKPNINNSRRETFYVTRLKTPEEFTDKKGVRNTKKYNFPKGAETYPFFTPGLCDKFERAAKIETLVLTEGYFKAFKGYMSGLDVVGLSSISHYKEKETQKMYSGVLEIISRCMVENIIILYDGDARNISLKDLTEKRDLRRRPVGFVNSARNVRELLKDCKTDIYFACIASENITGNPKGLDDLFCALPAETAAITADLTAYSRQSSYFHRFPIKFDLGKLYKFFCLDTVDNFRALHAEPIGNREFNYNGTTYQYNPDKGTCDVKVPGEARNYFRVGDDYYKFVEVPNKYNQNEKRFVRRLKTTIELDHGKKIVSHIPKYEVFCNVPDHVNFQQVINNCFNVYAPFEHEPDPGDCDAILSFILHIFGNKIVQKEPFVITSYDLGLDYIQLLYQRPTQILPILCLVSKENKTGKSTFIKLIKAIFGQNATVVGNEELANQFNSFWSTKLVVAVEETFVDKKSTTERIKSLSTGDKITMNAKGRDQVEIDFFAKFILASNNEDTFIYASRDDIRYWVVKVPVLAGKENVRLLNDMIDEIPAFLDFLNKRQMTTENETRMWFRESLIRTEALEKLIHNSRPGIEKEIYEYLKSIYFEFGETEILLSPTNANDLIIKRKQEIAYLSRIFRENFKVKPFTNDEGKEVPKAYTIPYWGPDSSGDVVRLEHKFKGRPFVFRAAEILDARDLETFRILHPEPAARQPEPEAKPVNGHQAKIELFPDVDDEDLPF